MIIHELKGKRFGRLMILHFSGYTKAQKKLWLCECNCGKIIKTTTGDLISGTTQSCGCLQRERTSIANRKHGASNSGTYSCWRSMMARCYRKTTSGYNRYGGRGIIVCFRWHTYSNFLVDMGERPSEIHSIDRIDGSGNYEPNNCRWATPKEQAANRRCKIVGEKNLVEIGLVKAYKKRRNHESRHV